MLPSLTTSIATVMCATAMLAAVFLHLARLGIHRRAALLWGAGFAVVAVRLALRLAAPYGLPWAELVVDLLLGVVMALIWAGTRVYARRPVHLAAIALINAAVVLWLVVASVVHLPFFWYALPPYLASGLVLAHVGAMFRSHHRESGLGVHRMLGWVFTLKGLLVAAYPLLRPEPAIAPLGFAVAAVLMIAAGILLMMMALDETMVRFRALANDSPMGVLIFDEQGRARFCNPRYYEMIGMTPAQVDAGRWRELVHPDDTAAMERDWAEARRSGRGFVAERRYCLCDGRTVWYRIDVRPLTAGAGARGFVCTIEDVTARRDAERAAARARAELERERVRVEAIFRATPTPIVITGLLDGRYLDFNEAFAQTLGYARDEWIGRKVLDSRVWVAPSQREALVRTLLDKGAVRAFPARLRCRDGRELDMLVYADLVQLDEERCMIGSLIDAACSPEPPREAQAQAPAPRREAVSFDI